MKLQNQVALVTGSATGIGRATALALAAEGADLIVNYTRSRSEAEATGAAVEALGRRVLLVQADVSQEDQVDAMMAQVEDAFGRLDVLVNNAGFTRRVEFRDLDGLTEEDWDRTFAVNVKGTFFCARAAAKLMARQEAGCIVNVASVAGLRPAGSSIAYCASKAAVVSLTGTLAKALAPRIRVNAVAPGFIATRWNEELRETFPQIAESTPLGRVGTAEDIAEVIRSLVTSAGFMTGQVVTVDGGRLL